MSEKVEAAFNRANSAQENGQTTDSTTTTDSPTTNGQAAGSNGNSDSTQSGSDDQQADDNGEASGDPEKASDSTSTTPLTAPESWPEERKDAFNSLDQKGQETLLSFYDDMVKGLNKSQEKLASEREALKSNFGAEPEALKELVETAKSFESDPVSTLSKLAEQAGVDIFFTPQEEETIPDFESAEEQTRWLLKQQEQRANQAASDKAKEHARERAQIEQKQQITEQFAEAHKAHPDLADHRDAVTTNMVTHGVPVEQAYRLATYDGLATIAAQASDFKVQLGKAQAEIETLKKSSTVPPKGSNGSERVKDQRKQAGGLPSMVEAAAERAERKRAKG